MTDQDLIDLLARENERLEVECERMRASPMGYVMIDAQSLEVLLIGAEHAQGLLPYHSPLRLALINFRAANKAVRTPAPPAASEEGTRDA